MRGGHMQRRVAILCMVAATLVGCGGGGGGGGGGLPILPQISGPAPSTAPGGQVQTPQGYVLLSGTATYESIPNPAGALVYADAASKPIRGAVVDVLDSKGAVLASTQTNGQGGYATNVPADTMISVLVRAQLLRMGSAPNWDVSVRDNTRSDALYSLQTPSFSSGSAALTRDIHAPSGWNGSRYSGIRTAAPFAVLDTVYAAQVKVLEAAPNLVFPPLRIFWSGDNLPASGNLAMGQIGTTFFADSPSAGKVIYVLGKQDVDTDEFDASVVAHEWGHYYQASFSRDDSPGGSHAISERVDRRLAFSEGWGNAWSGIALGRSNYTDSVGIGQSSGSALDLSAGPAAPQGWYREASIQTVLWNLHQQVGFKPIHDAMVAPAFRKGIAVTSIHPFTAAFKSLASAGAANALTSLLAAQNISSAADPFGGAETNDGTDGIAPSALPMYRSAGLGSTTNVCVTNRFGADNKHGSYAYLRFAAPASRNYTIKVASPLLGLAADPDITVFQGGEIARSEALGTSETAVVAVQAGDSVIAVNDYNNSSASTCFTVTIE